MPRPLIQHGVGHLEALFASSKTNLKMLKQLEHELQFRQVPRALALLDQVQIAMPAAGPASAIKGTISEKQPNLCAQPPEVQPAAPPPPRPSTQRATPEPLPAADVTQRLASSMAIDDACKVLKVLPTSSWQDVELARRQLVKLSHPAHIAALSPEHRDQVRSEAMQVNTAYLVLSASKVR